MTDPSKMPNEPLSPLMEGAVSMFEMFQSLVDAGFTEAQALWLITHFPGASQDSQP